MRYVRTLGLVVSLLLLLLLGGAQVGYAQCPPGAVPKLELIADGVPRTTSHLGKDAFPGGQNILATYFFQVTAGRSYSLQTATIDPEGTGLVVNATLVHGCGPDGTTRDTSRIDPQLLNDVDNVFSGRRISFIPSTSGGVGFNFQYDGMALHMFQIVLVETTLFNPAWSTFGTFETFYSCVNTTNDSTLDATLTLFNTAGVQVGSPFNFTNVPAGGTASTNTGTLGVANNLNGSATLIHNGPPGAFTCEAAIANFAVTPNIIQPVKFEAARETR